MDWSAERDSSSERAEASPDTPPLAVAVAEAAAVGVPPAPLPAASLSDRAPPVSAAVAPPSPEFIPAAPGFAPAAAVPALSRELTLATGFQSSSPSPAVRPAAVLRVSFTAAVLAA